MLLVDDSPEQRHEITALLADSRLEIVEAESGQAALELVQAGEFAIILIDVRMLSVSGFELAEKIRRLEPARDIPIMFLTSTQVPEAHVRKGCSLGAVDFLVVPVIPEVFRAKVEFFAEFFRKKVIQARKVEVMEEKTLERLKRSEDRYRRLFETAQDGILILDAKSGRIMDVNPFLAGLLGYPQQELLGKELWEIGLFRDIEANREAFVTLQEKGYLRYDNLPLLTKDGKKKEVEFVSNAYRAGHEDVVQCNIRDVTERKKSEEVLRHSESNLRQAQKTDALGKLSGGIAHDFNNLLTAMNGYSELCLSMVAREGPLYEYLNEILKAGERASALTHQLLAFSRKQVLAPKILNLSGLVTEVLNLLRRLIEENIRLTPLLDPQLWLIKADKVQMHQILLNLTVNARDAVSQGGEITIQTRNVDIPDGVPAQGGHLKAGQYVLLSVGDTGMGMDGAILARIFEPFFTTKDIGKGSGMGLATVEGIVKQSGGGIVVESGPGRGTVFKVYFPRVDGVEEKSESRAVLRSDFFRGTETILVAEDDAMVRTFTRRALELYGYTVLEAEDGDGALDLSASHKGTIHLLITDILMPGMNGRELADQFKWERPDTTVLFMSGYTDEVVVNMGLLKEFDLFLQKPFSPVYLNEVVSAALRAKSQISPLNL